MEKAKRLAHMRLQVFSQNCVRRKLGSRLHSNACEYSMSHSIVDDDAVWGETMLQDLACCRRIRVTQVHIVRCCRNHYVVRVNGKQLQNMLLCSRVRQQKQKTAECVCVATWKLLRCCWIAFRNCKNDYPENALEQNMENAVAVMTAMMAIIELILNVTASEGKCWWMRWWWCRCVVSRALLLVIAVQELCVETVVVIVSMSAVSWLSWSVV
jgi:hypothetical protein